MKSINIVINLELKEVSWVHAFINNSNLPNISVSSEFSPLADINIFLGDNIPWSNFTKHSSFIVYYLAATSFNKLLESNKASEDMEVENIRRSDLVVLTSESELNLLKEANLFVNFEKIIIAGFPLDTKRYLPYAETNKKTDICFISDLSNIKNPEFQYELIPFLKNQGYTISHFHTSETMHDNLIGDIGCKVYKRLEHEEFIKKLAEHRFCISVSKYESLSVSSIEAALLGCIPICPAHSGFLDWCDLENCYKKQSSKEILSMLCTAQAISTENIIKYDYQFFYKNILSAYNQIDKCYL